MRSPCRCRWLMSLSAPLTPLSARLRLPKTGTFRLTHDGSAEMIHPAGVLVESTIFTGHAGPGVMIRGTGERGFLSSREEAFFVGPRIRIFTCRCNSETTGLSRISAPLADMRKTESGQLYRSERRSADRTARSSRAQRTGNGHGRTLKMVNETRSRTERDRTWDCPGQPC